MLCGGWCFGIFYMISACQIGLGSLISRVLPVLPLMDLDSGRTRRNVRMLVYYNTRSTRPLNRMSLERVRLWVEFSRHLFWPFEEQSFASQRTFMLWMDGSGRSFFKLKNDLEVYVQGFLQGFRGFRGIERWEWMERQFWTEGSWFRWSFDLPLPFRNYYII